jgi:hypothetical protein
MPNARPDPANDRDSIARQLDDFLNNIQTSAYTQLEIDDSKTLLTNAGIQNLQDLRDVDGNTLSLNPALTMALSPALPMTFSTANFDGDRISFTLLINPNSLNHGKTSAVYASYTRKGFITQLWGPNQDLLTSTGMTAAFMVDGIGLTSTSRRRSFGMKNFFGLLYAYRNNGYQLMDPASGDRLTRVINKVRGIEVNYDGQTFMGHFNNFTLDENAEKPFLFDYNFEFVVSSLSNNYEEIRGHFDPIPIAGSAPSTATKLVNQKN